MSTPFKKMTDRVKTYSQFCPALWTPGMAGNRGSSICAFSNKKDPKPARSSMDFDVIYQCFTSDKCPDIFENWALVMADRIDSDLCVNDSITLGTTFYNGKCAAPGISPDPTPPQPVSPQSSPTPSGPSHLSPTGSRHDVTPSIWTSLIVGVAGFVILCFVILLLHRAS
jgi:hypothetical protein